MTDQMPDFDSMSPEEIMAWMEALAVRQGATEGIINDVSNVQVAEIDPTTVDIADEYIPYGMDPEVWAKKKAAEDAAKADIIAARKAERDAKGGVPAPQPPAPKPPVLPTPPVPVMQPEPEPAPLDFMNDLLGSSSDNAPDLMAALSASAPTPEAAAPADDMFGGLDFLSNLGQAASDNMGDLGSLDFSGLDALGADEPAAGGLGLDWLENMVSDAKPADSNEFAAATLPDTAQDALSETAVGRILDDPMDWLSDFSEDKPMVAAPAATNLDALFAASQAEITPTGDAATDEIRSALKEGSAKPDDVLAWMDSMLDKGLNRTDVVEEDDTDDSKPLEGEIPDWLVSQVGAPPDLSASAEAVAEGETDLPEWLTTPVSEEQTAEFEAIFTEAVQEPPSPVSQPSVLDNSPSLGLLDTSAIQVEMSDPWVEAFELERSERMGDTDQLADWYTAAQSELKSSTDSIETLDSKQVKPIAASGVTLQPANLRPESDLPVGESQSVPSWLSAEAAAPAATTRATSENDIPDWLQTETLEQPVAGDDSDLPDWLKPQVEASAPVDEAPLPPWLDKRVVTDEFTAMPDTPIVTPMELPVPTERPVRRPALVPTISPSEIAQLLNSARGSLKMGDVGAMVEKYETLIRAQAALEEVTTDLATISRDPAHKGNPAVLRVYGDALMRQGKLQAALDTYRAALNLL